LKKIGPIILTAVFLSLYIVFLIWYGGNGKPLTDAEVNTLIAEMQQRSGNSGKPESLILQEFRNLAGSDDGKEYYMINLLKFRQKALYPEGSGFNDNPIAANNRYNIAIVPLLFKYAAHPVFAGNISGRFISLEGNAEWDQVAMVRYRSRRDMMKMAVEIAGSRIDVHKWAAFEKTHVFPVKPIVDLTFIRIMAAVCWAVIAFFIHLFLRRFTFYKKP
jgi:hypothetical protein